MGYQQLRIENLRDIDSGRLATAFNQLIANAIADCDDRPGEKGDRKVVLTVKIRPVLSPSGACESCEVEVDINDKLPARKSRTYRMEIDGGELLFFNPEAPESARQRTIDEVIQAPGGGVIEIRRGQAVDRNEGVADAR